VEVSGVFRDEVVQLIRVEDDCSVALVERMVPSDDAGTMVLTGKRYGAIFSGYAQEHLQEIQDLAWEGPVFLGGANVGGASWRLGDWCDVLPWKPIPDGSPAAE
jgi:hypothetical protein